MIYVRTGQLPLCLSDNWDVCSLEEPFQQKGFTFKQLLSREADIILSNIRIPKKKKEKQQKHFYRLLMKFI